MRLTSRARGVLVAGVVMLGALAGASSASAVSLEGPWADHTRCPVDDPAMLSNPTGAETSCVEFQASPAQLTIGTKPFADATFSMEFGLAGSSAGIGPTESGGASAAYAVLDTNPCPGPILYDPLMMTVYNLCTTLVGETSIPMSLELAGTPSNFDPVALRGKDARILTLPVKLHVRDDLLGPNCYIGSDQDPIVLQPSGVDGPYTVTTAPDPNGFPVAHDTISNGLATDSTFGVPGATGCGPAGLLDGVVDALFRLPSPPGKNSFTMGLYFKVAHTTAGGQVLSDAWHAAAN